MRMTKANAIHTLLPARGVVGVGLGSGAQAVGFGHARFQLFGRAARHFREAHHLHCAVGALHHLKREESEGVSKNE